MRQTEQLGDVPIADASRCERAHGVVSASTVGLGVGHRGTRSLDRHREVAEPDVPLDVELVGLELQEPQQRPGRRGAATDQVVQPLRLANRRSERAVGAKGLEPLTSAV